VAPAAFCARLHIQRATVVVAGQPTDFSNYQDTPRWTGDAFTTVSLCRRRVNGVECRSARDAYYQTSQAFTSLLYKRRRQVHCFPPTRSSNMAGGLDRCHGFENSPSLPMSRISLTPQRNLRRWFWSRPRRGIQYRGRRVHLANMARELTFKFLTAIYQSRA